MFVASCWTPDLVFALTFGGEGGWLLRGSLAVRRVTVSECEGIAGTSSEFGTVWHADDAAYRKRFAWQGIDWLTYGDMSGHGLSVTTDVFGRRVFLYREV